MIGELNPNRESQYEYFHKDEVVRVKLSPPERCSVCGLAGAHFCPGPPGPRVIYAGYRE